MCEINKDKCECNAKEICCKMQKASLRTAISSLKNNQDCSNTILHVLEATYEVLDVYDCLPGTCLLKRVQWVHYHIKSGSRSLYISERTKLDMLIAELEVFLDS